MNVPPDADRRRWSGRPAEAFFDRREGGRRLAELLQEYAGRNDVIVLALPRGGVPVGYEVASVLGVPLDIWLVRKLGVPGHEELAMGAIAAGGARVLNNEVVWSLGITPDDIDQVATREQRELERREHDYRGDRPLPDLAGKLVIVVDDGLATGSTMKAAVQSLRRLDPSRIVVAVPVAPAPAVEELEGIADQVVCVLSPEWFGAVGLWYEDFSPTTDADVRDLLEKASETRQPRG